jgi:putative endonuclease
MPLTRQQLGELGEQRVGDYLVALGWRVVTMRFRTQTGEIDLICRDRDVLVFVEVRARTSNTFGDGIESVNTQKVLRMSRVAQAYLHQYNWNGLFRMDVVGLQLSRDGELKSLNHIRDITI